MKHSGQQIGWLLRISLLVWMIIFLGGCATGPKIDWNSRIGSFTYDQAVLEMGPPDKLATLQDGTKVAEWLTSRGLSQGWVTGFGPAYYGPYFYGPPGLYYSEPPAPDRYLRLTFGPDNRLISWKRVIR